MAVRQPSPTSRPPSDDEQVREPDGVSPGTAADISDFGWRRREAAL
jgi:hypothetical protein